MKIERAVNGWIVTVGQNKWINEYADNILRDMMNGLIPLPHEEATFGDRYAGAKEQARQGNMITAIKMVREMDGIGLRESKDLVDSWIL